MIKKNDIVMFEKNTIAIYNDDLYYKYINNTVYEDYYTCGEKLNYLECYYKIEKIIGNFAIIRDTYKKRIFIVVKEKLYKLPYNSKNGSNIYFKKGTRIKLKNTIGCTDVLSVNDTGTILKDTYSDINDCMTTIPIEFDNNFAGGHSCSGTCPEGKGYYVYDINLELLEEDKPLSIEDKLEQQILALEGLESLTKEVKKLTSKVEKNDPFQKAMTEAIIEKGKEIATKDLEERIKNNLDTFIKDTYGILPKRIEIVTDKKTKKIDGIFHKDFEKICKIVSKDIPLMLVGGAGAGKNYTLEQVAEALDLTFYTTNAVNQEYKLTGFIDANGKYHETEFYKAFKNGGLFFLDEIDASSPEALIILNSAIANRYFDFPIGRVQAHKDFRVVGAGNTYGTGADMVYVGRNVLDGATLDRFVVLEFDYDEDVERQLAYDEDLFKFVKDLRNAINKVNLRYIVSMRALINSTKLLELGIDKFTILKTTILKNIQKDDLNIILQELDSGNSWYSEVKRLSD